MWRIANCVYRTFRNTATHRCPQDILIPITTICNTDDDSKTKDEEKCSSYRKINLYQVLKNHQFSYKNIETLQGYFRNISVKQVTNDIEPPKIECLAKQVSSKDREEALNSLLKADETCMNTLQNLSDLHEETMSIINLQLAIDALESGNLQFGIEALHASAKNGTNAAALYNLGICYERGIGVEQDRAKACDCYRQASSLGHINAQFNLTLLSNHIDINEDESIEQTIVEKPSSPSRQLFFRFLLSNDYKEEQSSSDYQFDFKNQTIAYLS